ncbi:MAG TPA: anhydro-N-acetylmuramic acid kinase, partial [Chitinophagales bacterium]|nr:anhydro-N-acetylmuramic acid kinase [Chitinophagales bacterium]
MDTYHVIGLMSGSSLDGLDIAYCRFGQLNGRWEFEIVYTDVAEYPNIWIPKFKSLPTNDAKALWETHAALGHYFGERVSDFINKYSLQGKVDLVASHGHTIFHFPGNRFTTQIGDGAAIAARAGVPVVCDFRTSDIANGGQGTPIVPIGDKLLFNDYKFCLNIGGIANISCKTKTGIVAFDICAANQVLNHFAQTQGKEYDAGGEIAQKGILNIEMLDRLNTLQFYKHSYPKSLDNSFSRDMVLPIMEEFSISVEDKMHTYVQHIAIQIAAHVNGIAARENISITARDKMLVTGGGAFNTFLIERMSTLGIDVEVPNEELVKFKEAVVIALMGVLRMRNEVNVLSSVTGASKDTVGGAVYLP